MEVVGIEPGKSMQVISRRSKRSFASILDIGQASFGLKRVPLANFNATSDCVPISFKSRLCFGEIHAMNTRIS